MVEAGVQTNRFRTSSGYEPPWVASSCSCLPWLLERAIVSPAWLRSQQGSAKEHVLWTHSTVRGWYCVAPFFSRGSQGSEMQSGRLTCCSQNSPVGCLVPAQSLPPIGPRRLGFLQGDF